MISAKKIDHLFAGPAMFSNETSDYMQKKYNLTPEGKPIQEPQKQVTPTRSGGGGSSGTLPNDKSGLDRPHLYKKGGKVTHDWHGFGKGSTGKHKHGF